MAYNAGCWDLAKISFNTLWDHFVLDAKTFQQVSSVWSIKEDTELKMHQLVKFFAVFIIVLSKRIVSLLGAKIFRKCLDC